MLQKLLQPTDIICFRWDSVGWIVVGDMQKPTWNMHLIAGRQRMDLGILVKSFYCVGDSELGVSLLCLESRAAGCAGPTFF